MSRAAVHDGRFCMMGLRYGSGRLQVIAPRHLVLLRRLLAVRDAA